MNTVWFSLHPLALASANVARFASQASAAAACALRIALTLASTVLIKAALVGGGDVLLFSHGGRAGRGVGTAPHSQNVEEKAASTPARRTTFLAPNILLQKKKTVISSVFVFRDKIPAVYLLRG